MPTKHYLAGKVFRHHACYLPPFLRRGLSQYGELHFGFGQCLGFVDAADTKNAHSADIGEA